MSSLPDESRVILSSDELTTWLFLAHGIRTLGFVVEELTGPAEPSEVGADDLSYPPERLSKWMLSYMRSAAEHLGQWADLAIPRHACTEVTEILMHYRPHLLIGRAGLECASQGLWIMSSDEPKQRVLRHIQLIVVDFQEEVNALKSVGDDAGARRVGDEIQAIHEYARTNLSMPSVPHVRYKNVIRHAAEVLQADPAEWEYLWRKASAAAHGKKWISDHVYDSSPGAGSGEGEALAPRPSEISSVIGAAHSSLHAAVILYCLRSGINAAPLFRKAVQDSLEVVPAQPGHARDKELFLSQMEAHNRALEENVEMIPFS